MNDKIEREDVVRFGSSNEAHAQHYASGRSATGEELMKHRAGETLTNLARQHAERHKCGFSDALKAVSKICPGEMKDYLGYAITDSSRLLPRGTGRPTEIFFQSGMWSFEGVMSWLRQQGFHGGKVISTSEGFTWVPDPYLDAFPR